MTEDEAKRNWCPFARSVKATNRTGGGIDVNGAQPSLNRYTLDDGVALPGGSLCIGSRCMAWRWDYAWASSTEEGQGGDLVLRLKPLSGKPRMGWCGLAGKP